ncbi:alpha-glucosidase family protein [Marinimicrobium sp. C6131]|uniref:alpha-glucosidase family protein n=1 Tax=Marinimicrobium sp. C6131 TaxID=3022676 RepID=UPI00223CF9AA|nr:alpha-glucosidase family protein [Marinimicrobium sp. C6131]UZJ43464.1 alpha-glucosidase family protein [Marinimicrobium sp. C6131]
MQTNPWWRGAVIYQVYPRSLMDSNADGIGDIPGIIDKLDYIASLGVDAIWVSPFFKSPMKDFGYDISDYRDIDPIFGNLDDFDRLIERAHAKGIKIIIDQVLSHTSDQHAWFEESRQCRDNPKADWYVWADPREDGTPPNNWLSIFGGCAWEWEPRREQYYLHNFLKSQPDLNFHNPEVRAEILDEIEFWLKKGVDGLRLDAITFCFHDQQLRDNPAKPKEERKGRGFSEDNPYAFQYHWYNNDRPENLQFLESVRELMDRYPGSVTLGEISSEDSLATMAEYTKGDKRLHTTYSFELLVEKFSTQYIRETVETLESRLGGGWPCWSIGNHDVRRVMTRWGGADKPDALAKLFNAMMLSLRGSACSYQGEELGLTEADIQQHELQDPYGITFWPRFKGRDGCRTPMPWQHDQHQAGFSTAPSTWLPIPEEHKARAVDIQNEDPNSVLNAYRTFINWRNDQPALRLGDIEFLNAPEGQMLFTRRHDDQSLLVAMNFTGQETTLALNGLSAGTALEGHGFIGARIEGRQVILPAYGAGYFQLDA